MPLLIVLLFLSFALSDQVQAATAEDEFASAEHLALTGAFEDSVPHWKKADSLFEKAKNPSGQVETEIHLAATYHALGQTRLAIDTLTHAQEIALPGDLKHRAQIKAALGAIYTLATPAAKDHSLHHFAETRAGEDVVFHEAKFFHDTLKRPQATAAGQCFEIYRRQDWLSEPGRAKS